MKEVLRPNKGDVFVIFGHNCKVTSVRPYPGFLAKHWGYRVLLDCILDCCTSPNGLQIKCNSKDLVEFTKINPDKR